MRLLDRFAACVLFLLLAGVPLHGGPVILTDNFNDNVLNPSLWSIESFGPATMAEINGRLEFTIASNGGVLARVRGLAVGNFDLRFDYILLSDMDSMDPDEEEPAVGTLWFFPDSEKFLLRTIESTPLGVRGCYGAELADGVGEACYAATAALSGSLRLARTGNLYSAYYREGSDWVLLVSGTSALTGPADLWLGGGVGGERGLSAAIDNFYLQADGFLAEVPEPSSLALAGCALVLLPMFLRRRQPDR